MSNASDLRQAILDIVLEHRRAGMLPTSIRFIYYELIAKEIISKVRTGARRTDQNTIDAITKLREDEEILWEDIEDETRELSDFLGSKTIRQAALDSLKIARLDVWKGNPPLILTESRSLAGVLRALAYEYGARIASTNGQCAGFLHNKLVPVLREGAPILYLGDEDFSGGHIEANTKRVLERKVGCLAWKRLAVTDRQIERLNLTVIQKYDARTKSHHDAVETEALGQARIVDIVQRRLAAMLPEPLKRRRGRKSPTCWLDVSSAARFVGPHGKRLTLHLKLRETQMKTLIIALCLAATPAAAQYQPPDNDREQHDRDRSEWRHEQNRQEDEQRQYDHRDHSDDEPDTVLATSARYSWPHNCCHYGR